MLPVYVPALRPAVETDTERVEGAVPEAGVTLSHDPSDAALAVAAHVRVPPPLLAIWID